MARASIHIHQADNGDDIYMVTSVKNTIHVRPSKMFTANEIKELIKETMPLGIDVYVYAAE